MTVPTWNEESTNRAKRLHDLVVGFTNKFHSKRTEPTDQEYAELGKAVHEFINTELIEMVKKILEGLDKSPTRNNNKKMTNAYIHWRDRELMSEPPRWNEESDEEREEREAYESDQADRERKYIKECENN